jgi:hypothetical protein
VLDKGQEHKVVGAEQFNHLRHVIAN